MLASVGGEKGSESLDDGKADESMAPLIPPRKCSPRSIGTATAHSRSKNFSRS